MIELWDILDENGNITGRLHERGKPMVEGDYHLVVHVWIMNHKGEFLISKRRVCCLNALCFPMKRISCSSPTIKDWLRFVTATYLNFLTFLINTKKKH